MINLEQHLKSRHLDLALHRPILDHQTGVATFLLYNLSGQLTGYQQYRPTGTKEKGNDPKSGRYYTHKSKDRVSVFGVESLHLTPNVVFVTEGIFDAVRLTERGVSALAILSNNPALDVKNFIRSLGRKVIAVCDNDDAGRKLAKLGDHAVFTDTKDLGDSNQEYVDNLINQFVKNA